MMSPYIYAWFIVFGTPEYHSEFFKLMIFFETYFFFDIVLNFFLEYEEDGLISPVRDLAKIARNYIKGDFLIDFIAILPINFLPLGGDEQLFYILKIVRISKAVNNINPSSVYDYLISYNMERINKMIDDEDDRADS